MWLKASASTLPRPRRPRCPSGARARRRRPAWRPRPSAAAAPRRARRPGRRPAARARASARPASTNVRATPFWARSTIASGSPAPTTTPACRRGPRARGSVSRRRLGPAGPCSRGVAPAAAAPCCASQRCSGGALAVSGTRPPTISGMVEGRRCARDQHEQQRRGGAVRLRLDVVTGAGRDLRRWSDRHGRGRPARAGLCRRRRRGRSGARSSCPVSL